MALDRDRIQKAVALARASGRNWDGPVDPAHVAEYSKREAAWPLVELSDTRLEQERVLTPGADDHTVHAYKALRTQVAKRMREHDFRTLAVVSAGPDDGKTLTTLNLGISLAADPERLVRIVEFDLRQPSILERLGISVASGVEAVLEGRAEPDEVILRFEDVPRLSLMPAVQSTANSSELLASSKTKEFVNRLRTEMPNQITIFDLPPMLAYDDALTFAPSVDAVLIVVSEGISRRADVARCFELLGDVPVIGTVLNRSREHTQRYYYY